jgi:hypothetical protein
MFDGALAAFLKARRFRSPAIGDVARCRREETAGGDRSGWRCRVTQPCLRVELAGGWDLTGTWVQNTRSFSSVCLARLRQSGPQVINVHSRTPAG